QRVSYRKPERQVRNGITQEHSRNKKRQKQSKWQKAAAVETRSPRCLESLPQTSGENEEADNTRFDQHQQHEVVRGNCPLVFDQVRHRPPRQLIAVLLGSGTVNWAAEEDLPEHRCHSHSRIESTDIVRIEFFEPLHDGGNLPGNGSK